MTRDSSWRCLHPAKHPADCFCRLHVPVRSAGRRQRRSGRILLKVQR